MLSNLATIKDQKPPEIRQKRKNPVICPAVREYQKLVENDQIVADPWSQAPLKFQQIAQHRDAICKEIARLDEKLSLTSF